MQQVPQDERQSQHHLGDVIRMADRNANNHTLNNTHNRTYQGMQLDGNATNLNIDDRTLGRTSGLYGISADSRKTFGLCLGNAPQLEQEAFIGRSAELQQLQEWFQPARQTEQVVSIVGMGGLGKTQLSLVYAREYSTRYTSIFWVNAKDELNLRHGFGTMADMIMADTVSLVPNTKDEQSRVEKVRRWLSEERNHQWLMKFDNYDDPDLPNIHSKSGFIIKSYFPYRTQGHILITTRTPKLSFSKRLILRRFDDVEYSLTVLAQRAGRDLTTDANAQMLAEKLDGLPLALATAGVYLSQTNISCLEYLQLYQSAWMELYGPDTEELFEYEDRTLSSTWVLSFDQVCRVDADAAELSKFWAYFSNKDLWYELIRAGSEQGPSWMSRITANKLRFDRAMARLQDYSLVEVTTSSYDIHPCIHTWVSAYFDFDRNAFRASLNCIVRSIPRVFSMQYWEVTHRLLSQIDRLNDDFFQHLWDELALDQCALDYMNDSTALLYLWDRIDQAEKMYARALTGYRQTLGQEDPLTLCAMVNLGMLHSHQGRWIQADKIYLEALAGYERTQNPDLHVVIYICHNLGLSYREQGKLEQAEEMLVRALAEIDTVIARNDSHSSSTVASDQRSALVATTLIDTALGHEHPSRLRILNHLGLVYWGQGKLMKAESALSQALAGSEEALGDAHPWNLHVLHNLGSLYQCLGSEDESEQMLLRALAGREAILGPDHKLTLETVDNLGVPYQCQGEYEKAEEQFARVHAVFQSRPISMRLFGTVSNLTRSLNKRMKAGTTSQPEARLELARLLPTLEAAQQEDSFNDKYHTARVILALGVEENALTAFFHARAVVCDGCDVDVNTAHASYYVCRQCVSIDLCNFCKAKFDEENMMLPSCEGHEFLDVNAATLRFPDRAKRLDREGMKAWIERLRQEYPVIDDT